MNKKLKNFVEWMVIFMVVFILLMFTFCSGCKITSGGGVNPPTPDTAAQFYEAVKQTNWLITVSIIGIAVSAAAFFNGSKLALGTLIGSGVALTMSLMVVRYATVVAFAGLVGSGMVIILVALRNKKVFKELVQTVEKTKEHFGDSYGKTMFFNKDSHANEIQSKSTKRIVDKIQKSLNNKEN